jgi:nucleotide-binding universal stress UspA family protein
MLTFKSILCPVDFSDQSQHALRWAIGLAARHQSRLTVMSVVDPLLAEAAKARLGLDLVKTETEPALRALVNDTLPKDAAWAPQPAYEVPVGEASNAILEAAARHHADLIVMGTHGMSGFRKWLIGSTTERVLRRVNTPLLAVPLSTIHPVHFDRSGARFDFTRILMGTDFSAASAAALEWAADLARQEGVPLILFHAVPPVEVPSQWRSEVIEVDEERAHEARMWLEAMASRLGNAPTCEIVVAIGPPADKIAAIAEERRAGLIVVGLKGQRDPDSSGPGSIAYRVLCLGHVPVLVVPPHAEAGNVPSVGS